MAFKVNGLLKFRDRNQQIQFESSLAAILGNKPNVTVHVDRVTSAPESKSLVLIYVQEKLPTGKSGLV